MAWTQDLRVLRAVAIAVPLLFVVVLYLFIEEQVEDQIGHAAVATGVGALVIAFALVMFFFIDRAQDRIVRQNRELEAINRVSTAIQGELAIEAIIDTALESVLASTHATEVSVTVNPPAGESQQAVRVKRRSDAPEAADAGEADGFSVIDIPLLGGSAVIGRLRIKMPTTSQDAMTLSGATLQSVGGQLAAAIQMSQLVSSLQRRRRESSALYEIALQVTSRYALSDILATTVRYARDLLSADDGVLCLSDPVSRQMGLDGTRASLPIASDGTVVVAPGTGLVHERHGDAPVCPVRSSPLYKTTLEAPLRTSDGSLGDLWVGRAEPAPFGESDAALLGALADLAAIAVTSARTREIEREAAVLAERERIAREMHDSLAQVLGSTHLRLRHLAARVDEGKPPTVEELQDLADRNEEAYRDVREGILGLREASHLGRGFIHGLRAYVEKYSRQSGVHATLVAEVDEELSLAPGAEIQVIRVIQEALTNVRKHAGATSVEVRIVRDPAGTVTIIVKDDGHGFDIGRVALSGDGSFGLLTMRERMDLIGGTLSVESSLGRGTRVTASIPRGGTTALAPVEASVVVEGRDQDPPGR